MTDRDFDVLLSVSTASVVLGSTRGVGLGSCFITFYTFCDVCIATSEGLCELEHTVNLTPEMEYVGSNGYVNYTGVHLIIDLWKAENLCDAAEIERIFRQAVADCDATLLHIYMHEFTGGGITGVAVLSESHISIHTWPEFEYAALDIFLCGSKDPWRAINAIKDGFKPGSFHISEHKRGILND